MEIRLEFENVKEKKGLDINYKSFILCGGRRGDRTRLNLHVANSKSWLNSSNYNGIRSLFHLVRVRQSTAKFVQIRSVWGKFGERSWISDAPNLFTASQIHRRTPDASRHMPKGCPSQDASPDRSNIIFSLPHFLTRQSAHSLSKSPGEICMEAFTPCLTAMSLPP